uniref:Tripartite motif containing 36 n=1 Tax=Rhinolophus ferrumequinum TaxID=59479 RepID=A0A671FAT3_RHIFE
MSESGEISEFAYIMELLARGKASVMGLEQTQHSQLTSKVRETGRPCGISEAGKQALTVRTW